MRRNTVTALTPVDAATARSRSAPPAGARSKIHQRRRCALTLQKNVPTECSTGGNAGPRPRAPPPPLGMMFSIVVRLLIKEGY